MTDPLNITHMLCVVFLSERWLSITGVKTSALSFLFSLNTNHCAKLMLGILVFYYQ